MATINNLFRAIKIFSKYINVDKSYLEADIDIILFPIEAEAITSEDKLKLIKKYYPDAIPFGADNYVFTNPKTKQPTKSVPPAIDAR